MQEHDRAEKTKKLVEIYNTNTVMLGDAEDNSLGNTLLLLNKSTTLGTSSSTSSLNELSTAASTSAVGSVNSNPSLMGVVWVAASCTAISSYLCLSKQK